jgi:DNA replication protein DnaC
MDQDEAKIRKIALVRSILDGDGKAAESLPKLTAPRCALKAGCASCAGKGYVVGTRGALAHAEACACVTSCPACFGQARILEGNESKSCRNPSPTVVVNLINAAMIPARYADATLERFHNFSGNGRTFLAELKRWKARFKPVKGKGLLVTGPVGVGKTYLMAAIAKEMAEEGRTVRYTDFFQLLCDLKAGFSEGKADTTQLQPLIDVDVLIIDELGKGRNSDYELTVLDQLVSRRYDQNKTIIASTNYQLEQRNALYYQRQNLETPSSGSDFTSERDPLAVRIGSRMFSRLQEMTQFAELTGDDLRRQGTPR